MIEGSDEKIKDEEEQGDHAQANACMSWHASFVYSLFRDIRSIFYEKRSFF